MAKNDTVPFWRGPPRLRIGVVWVGEVWQHTTNDWQPVAIFRRGPLSRGHQMQMGRQKSRFPTSIWLHRVLSTLRPARYYQHGAAGPWQIVTLTAGSKRRSLLIAGDDDEVFMTRSLSVTPKTTEHNLITRSDKSVAYVTNNKRLRSTFCTILKLTMTDTKHHATSLRQQSYLYAKCFRYHPRTIKWTNARRACHSSVDMLVRSAHDNTIVFVIV